MQNDHFAAREVLAKHDETYMPKEVADAIKKAEAAKKIHAAD
jgi:cytochrome c-type biogenesis protein CcmE